MGDLMIGDEILANRRLAAEVSILESKLDKVMRINTHLRAEIARLRLCGVIVSDRGTGLQEGAYGYSIVEDSNDSRQNEPNPLLDLKKTDLASLAAKEDDTIMRDVHSTVEMPEKKKKIRRKGGKRHQKNYIPAGRSTPRNITIVTTVSDQSTPNMETILKTPTGDDEIATSTSKPILTIFPTSQPVKKTQQPEATPLQSR